MRKKCISIFIILSVATSLYAFDAGSKFSFGISYNPSITLDDNTDLPVYSAMASNYDFEPFYLSFYNAQVGAYLSIYHASRSIVYNNLYLRDFSAVATGLDIGYKFTDSFKLNTKMGFGLGNVGESTSKEMFVNFAIIPSYIFMGSTSYEVSLDFIVNVVYRKYLLSPTVGIGISIRADWFSKYLDSIAIKVEKFKDEII